MFLTAFIAWRRLLELGLNEEKIIDFIIIGGGFSLLLSRIFFIAENFPQFGFQLERWLFFGRYPGFSFWGGLIGFWLGLLWITKKQKWDFWQVGDEVIFGILPLLVLVQIGYFFDGSLLGRPTGMPWGVFFPGNLVRRQPVSLFAALAIFLIWIFLRRIERQWRIWEWYKSKANGLLTLSFWSLLLFSNLMLAFLKESKLYFFWGEFSLSLFGLIVSLGLIYRRAGRNLKEDLWKKAN